MVAVDDLSFTGDITCPTTTTPAADCLATATDFATELEGGLTKWSDYGSYAGFPTGTVGISDMCLTNAIPTSLFSEYQLPFLSNSKRHHIKTTTITSH